MRPHFSIARLLAVIVFCGVAFAALRSPTPLWANSLYTVASASLVLAAIHTRYGRGRWRAFWAGFLIAGGAYYAAYAVPALRESICPHLLTEPLLDLLYAEVAPSQSAPAGVMIGGGPGTVLIDLGSPGGTTWMMTGGPPPIAPAPISRWAAWTEPDRTSGVGYRVGSVTLVSPEAYRQIGHSLSILLLAACGGVYARHLDATNAGDTP